MQIKTTTAALAAGLCLAPAALAQNETGAGCPGFTGFTPDLELRNQIQDGVTTIADVTGAPSTACLLLASANNVTYAGLPLPLDLGLIFPELPGCTLYQNPKVMIPFNLDTMGDAAVPIGGWAAGFTVYFQVWNLDIDTVGLSQFGGFSLGYDIVSLPNGGVATAGDVVITEIMNNPSAVSDGVGEWFEVFNTTASPIDIEYWTLRDQDFDNHVIDNGGAGLVVPAGGYLVLGNSADMALNGGYTPDYVFPSVFGQQFQLFLSNSGDELELVDGAGTIIDAVVRDNGALWPDPNGASINLNPTAVDAVLNDDPANWCESTTPYGDGDLGTPGATNDTCAPVMGGDAMPGDILITEIMQNPSAVGDGDGEYFEVYNATASPIDLDGWVMSDNAGSFTVVGPLVVAAGGYQVFVTNGDSALNGGIVGGYEYSGAVALSNGSDELVVEEGGVTIDRVDWDNGATFPDTAGASMNLDPGSFDLTANDDGTNWCESSTVFGAGDTGTPGAANDTCPVLP